MLLLLLTLVLPWTIQERVLADTGSGSISIDLQELETPKAEVRFKAYKVGTWNSTTGNIELAECLKDKGIDLDKLVYAADWEKAALKLSEQTEVLETLSSINGITDQNGKLTFSDIELGMYLIIQDGKSEYGIVAPFLAVIPYFEEGIQNNDLTVQPKAEPPLAVGNGRIEVSMRIGKIEQRALEIADIMLMDEATYYVGIFRDAKGQIPYGTDHIREISMKGIRKGKAVFENLPEGTYYIFETDKDGNAYPINEKQTEQEDVWLYKLDHETESQKVTIDGKAESPAEKVGLYKQYYELNKNYCYAETSMPTETPVPTEAPTEPTETPAPTEAPAEPTETPVPTVEPTETPAPTVVPTDIPTVTPTGNNTDTTNAARTGDDTPIIKYLVLMVMAALLLIVGIVYWRGHKKHE